MKKLNLVTLFSPETPILIHLFVRLTPTLCEKCPYSELFWSTFSRIWTEYGEYSISLRIQSKMRENADQNNSEYEHFLRGATV